MSLIVQGAILPVLIARAASFTVWSRLEALPTSADLLPALQARIADPLWLLGRQWQFGELQAEDAGSPIEARVRGEAAPIARFMPGVPGVNAAVRARDYAASPLPLEVLVEREPARAAHPRLAAEAGLQFLRYLSAEGVPQHRARFQSAAAYRLDDVVTDPAADPEGAAWASVLAGALDGRKLADAFRPLADANHVLSSLPPEPRIPAASADAVKRAAGRWLHWYDTAISDPAAQPESWNASRQEYAFALSARVGAGPVTLVVDEYRDGRLDWYSFRASGSAALGDPATPAAAAEVIVPPMLPVPVRYPGMPADRYWEFEDGRVNFGMMGASKVDLARMAVIEYALVFGNDWFTLPVTLPVNALYRVATLDVLDNFGITVKIPPATNPDGTQWTMYEMSVGASPLVPRPRLNDILYLCPAVKTLEGAPLEHVLMMRDEMANMVWGIEKRVQGTSGEPLDRKFESHRLSTNQQLRPPPDAVPASGGAPLHYTLQTPVAAHWIPFLPVKKAGATPAQWAIELQRGVVTHHYQVTPQRLNDPRNAEYKAFIERLRAASFVERKPEQGPPDNRLQGFMFHPRGTLLRLDPNAAVDTDYLRIAEEEVPRDGIELKRAFNYARDAQGRALLWIGRSKTTGRGEGSSGLRFDVIRRGRS